MNGNHIFKMLGFQPCLRTPEPDPRRCHRPCICCWLHSWLRCGRSYSGGPSAKWGLRLKVIHLVDPILRPDENGPNWFEHV